MPPKATAAAAGKANEPGAATREPEPMEVIMEYLMLAKAFKGVAKSCVTRSF